MKFVGTELRGAFTIEPERLEDQRGFFARTFCAVEFEANGLTSEFVQSSVAFNRKRGMLRGMHYQAAPHQEVKLVRCTRGAIYDVIVDLRADSPTYRKWLATELSADNHRQLYIPGGFAHGVQTLTDVSEVFYAISPEYHPEAARGMRWDDPALKIKWPLAVAMISEQDRNFPLLED